MHPLVQAGCCASPQQASDVAHMAAPAITVKSRCGNARNVGLDCIALQSAARWASACDYHDRDAADGAVSVAVVNHELARVRSGRKTERAHIPNVFGRELLRQRGA